MAANRYEGKLESPTASGEAVFIAEAESLDCRLLFNELVIAYEEIESIVFKDYALQISAGGEHYHLFGMGQETEWLYDELKAAFNDKVVSVFDAEGEALMVTEGSCSCRAWQGRAELRLYSDCLCVLSPGKLSRRLPIVFMKGMKKESYSLELSLDPNEAWSFSMLGYDLEPLSDRLSEGIKKHREATRGFLSRLCTELGAAELAKSLGVTAEGIAAPLIKLPMALQKTLVSKAKNSRMGAYFERLCTVGDRERLAIGVKELPEETVEELKAELIERLSANAEGEVKLSPSQEDALRWIVWAAIPAKSGHTLVEFAFPNEDAASYVFKTEGEFDAFLPCINRAFEATGLKREIFSAAKEKLSPDMRMLLERSPEIKKLRELYVGKAAHTNPQAWEKSLRSLMEKQGGERPAKGKFCTQCGAKLSENAKFCSQCGNKIST